MIEAFVRWTNRLGRELRPLYRRDCERGKPNAIEWWAEAEMTSVPTRLAHRSVQEKRLHLPT